MNLNDDMKIIGRGNTADIYEIDDNRILKLYKKGIPKEIIEIEFNNTKVAKSLIDIVPRPFETVVVNDRNGAIYEKINGKSMLDDVVSSVLTTKKQAKLIAHYHFNMQKEITVHLVTVKEKLKDDIHSVTELTDKEKEKVLQLLEELPNGNTLCHFDFHPGNIIIRNKLPIIIDWMTLRVGDKCADVARTGILLRFGGIPHAPWVILKIISLLKNKLYRCYMKEYVKIAKVKQEEINRWEVPVAAARLREWIPDEEKQILLKLVRKNISVLKSTY